MTRRKASSRIRAPTISITARNGNPLLELAGESTVSFCEVEGEAGSPEPSPTEFFGEGWSEGEIVEAVVGWPCGIGTAA